MNGFLVVDKPVGATSHDIVALVRKRFGVKKVGHTGTLDPFATGVLPIAIGEGTKAIPFLDEGVKEYRAVMRLGLVTDTGDCTGTVIRTRAWEHLDRSAIEKVLPCFTGSISQVPPMYSALKRNGVPLYKLARRGETVEREPRSVTIHALTIEDVAFPDVTLLVSCSRGTYVRTLAEDLGEKLGCGAHLVQLRRLRSGPFTIDKAVTVEELALLSAGQGLTDTLISPYAALSHLRDLRLTGQGVARLAFGAVPDECDWIGDSLDLQPGEAVRLSFEGKLAAVAERRSGPCAGGGKESLRLLRVFN
ncbi:MAG TPA: tRNA pseudouridine(55) synthase TruB [Geobacteraceae bacterium]